MTSSRLIFLVAIGIATPSTVLAQDDSERISVVGTVYCRQTLDTAEVPAGNVKVQTPLNTAIIAGGVYTQTHNGFYRLPVRFSRVIDRSVIVTYKANGVLVDSQNVYASREKLRYLSNSIELQMPTVEIVADCHNLRQDAILEPAPRPNRPSVATVVAALLGGAATVVTVGAVGVVETPGRLEVDFLPIESLTGSPLPFGLLANARTLNFPSLGFRYAPGRDSVTSIATNPSASVFEPGWQLGGSLVQSQSAWPASVMVQHGSASGTSAGIGYYSSSDGSGEVAYDSGKALDNAFKLDEKALVAFVATGLGRRYSLSLGAEVEKRETHLPLLVRRETRFDSNRPVSVTDSIVRTKSDSTRADLSLGFSVMATPAVRIGAAVQNLVGSRSRQDDIDSERVIGVGAAWFRGRLHVGLDGEYVAAVGFDASVGAVYKMSRSSSMSVGYVTSGSSVRVGIRAYGIDYSLRLTKNERPSHLAGLRWDF